MCNAFAEERPSSASDRFEWAARRLLRLREQRKRHFQQVEITGPAWPLMLALYGHSQDSTELSLGDLSSEADVARTTALRWLRRLQRHGLVRLSTDPFDKRVVRVRITTEGRSGMHSAFASAAKDTSQA